jgi:O-antigen ligase
MTEQSLPGLSRSRRIVEILLAIMLASALGLGLGLMGGLSAKYQLAFMVGAVFLGVMVMFPERRLLCLLLWIMIQPLSIEKVFYVNAIYPDFVPQSIVINAGDALLLLLAGFMMLEAWFTHRKVWYWPRFATLFGIYVAWALVSALMHAVYLDTGYTGSSPWTLLHYLRTLLFIVIVHSAVRTRAELICVLVAIACIVFGEAILVALSYVTGELFNFARLTGVTPLLKLQTFSSGDGATVRGVGTLGHTNQQAVFHTLYTLPLIALLVVKNVWFRVIALTVMVASAVAILLSFSRSAWMSFALALLLVFVIAWKRREIAPVAWLTGALMTMLMAVVLGALSSPIYERVMHGDDGATDSRLRMISLATDLFLSHPIVGVGPGEFAEASLFQYPVGFQENEWVAPGSRPMVPVVGRLEVVRLVQPQKETLTSPLPVHNKYMLTLSELGAIGLFLWLCMYVHLFREAKACSLSRDPVLRYIGVGGMAAVLASMSYMMLDLFADDKSVQILFFVPLVVTAAARIVRETETGPGSTVP